jgi:hypothetical protein
MGLRGVDPGKAYSEPVLMPELVTLVTRIRCKLAQVATAGFPENFLCTQGGNTYIRKPTSGGGVSTYPTTRPPRSALPTPTGPERYSPNVAEWPFSEVRVRSVPVDLHVPVRGGLEFGRKSGVLVSEGLF